MIKNLFLFYFILISFCYVIFMREKILANEYIHIYSRGSDKKDLFYDKQDYYRFFNLLKYYNKKNTISFSSLLKKKGAEITKILGEYTEDYVEILIFTLMPNHFHLVIKCLGDGSVGKYMHKVLTAFAMYFNKKYSKTGHRFESKYKYRKIQDDTDLKNAINYVYLNPAKILDGIYSHIDFLNGKYRLSYKQRKFISKYPFTFQGPTLEILRLDLGMKIL